MRLFALFFVVLLAPNCLAQQQVLTDLSRAQLVAKWGSPVGYFDSRTQAVTTYFPHTSGAVWQVWHRKTSTQEYRILVAYKMDNSISRLHPTMRVSEVRFRLDKPKPARIAIVELREAANVCKAGCDVLVDSLGLSLRSNGFADRLVLDNVADLSGDHPVLSLDDIVDEIGFDSDAELKPYDKKVGEPARWSSTQ